MSSPTRLRRAAPQDADRVRRDYELIKVPLWTLIISTIILASASIIMALVAKHSQLFGFIFLWLLFAAACTILLIISLRHTSYCPSWLFCEWIDGHKLRLHRAYAPGVDIDLAESVIFAQRLSSASESSWVNQSLHEAIIESVKSKATITKLTKSELDQILSLCPRPPLSFSHYGHSAPIIRLSAWADHWFDSIKDHSASSTSATECLLEIFTRYIESGNAYHNALHIQECLFRLEEYESYVNYEYDYQSEIVLAIFYHDIIYDPKSSTNEEDSAEYFRDHAKQMALHHDLIEDVRRLILITKNHSKATRPDEQLMVDIDRAILAASSSRYFEYSGAIWQEYRHVDWEVYKAGRIAFLESQLAQEPLYFTEWAREYRMESAARANMQQELEDWTRISEHDNS